MGQRASGRRARRRDPQRAAVRRGPDAVEALAAVDPEDVPLDAMEVLGRLRDPRGIPVLERVLGSETGHTTRLWAIDALGNVGGARALEVLEAHLQVETDTELRRVAAAQIARLREH